MFWLGQVRSWLPSLSHSRVVYEFQGFILHLIFCMQLFIVDFEVKGRNYYMEVLDSMWLLSDLK